MISYDEVRETAKYYQLWSAKDTIVVAVSGGVDSMVLLYLLHHIAKIEELNLVVAHVNHGYRQAESALEKQLVEQCAKKLGWPFEYIELEMPQYLLTHSGNPQELARNRRYTFLFHVAEQYKANAIATAHHADDQVETVLQHFIRGSGLAGLSGMNFIRTEKNVQLIKPFLRITKDKILEYQKQYAIPFLEDSSNLKTEYTRNQLRIEAIPYLEQFNKNFKQAAIRLSELASDENDLLEQITEQYFINMVHDEGNSIKIKRSALTSLHVALQRRLIKLILNYLSYNTNNLSYESIERVREAAFLQSTTSKFNISNHVWCILEYEYVRFIREDEFETFKDKAKQVIIPCESTQLSFGNWEVSIHISHQQPTINDRFSAVFDAEALRFPLVVRTKQAGDRIAVQGLKGTKKLQDLFVDAKVPSIHRLQYPIICDQEQLIWVPGVRRSKHALVSEHTRVYVIIQVHQK